MKKEFLEPSIELLKFQCEEQDAIAGSPDQEDATIVPGTPSVSLPGQN